MVQLLSFTLVIRSHVLDLTFKVSVGGPFCPSESAMSQDEHPQPEYAERQCDLGPFAEYAKKKPKHVAIEVLPNPGPTLAIVTATPVGRQAVLARLDDGMNSVKVAGSWIIFGKIGRFDTVVLETKTGSMHTLLYLNKILPNLPSVVAVALVGFGWGSDPALKSAPKKKQRIGDIMFASECIDLSYIKRADGKVEVRGNITSPVVRDILDTVNLAVIEKWQRKHDWPPTWCRPPTVHKGAFVSMPTLLNDRAETLKILEAVKERRAIGGDMELYQIVKAVQDLEPPRRWFSVKAICDFAGLIPKVDDGQKLAAATAADFMHFLMNWEGLFDDLLAPPVAAVAPQPPAEINELTGRAVFISHSGSDRAFAENIRDVLKDKHMNISTWINTDDIGGGEEWRQKIDEALDKCQVVLVVASEKSYNSPYVTYEIGYAMGQKKPVIPLIYKNPNFKIHPRLRTLDYYDFRGKIWPFEGLLTGVHKLLECNHTKNITSKFKEDNIVFVSYDPTTERAFGNAITTTLKKGNISVQINILDQEQEDDWRRGIDKALDKCQVVLVIFSADSKDSLYVTYEFAYAMGQKKRVIPLICDGGNDDIHPRLKTLQRYDFRDTGNWPKERLLSDVKWLLGA